MYGGGVHVLDVAALGHARRIAPGHQRGARRPADRLRVEVREPHAFSGHLVEVRRADQWRAETTDILITLVVCKNEHKVRWSLLATGNCPEEHEQQKR